jgi:hypothetical protein
MDAINSIILVGYRIFGIFTPHQKPQKIPLTF